jgi:hypothetical protein
MSKFVKVMELFKKVEIPRPHVDSCGNKYIFIDEGLQKEHIEEKQDEEIFELPLETLEEQLYPLSAKSIMAHTFEEQETPSQEDEENAIIEKSCESSREKCPRRRERT